MSTYFIKGQTLIDKRIIYLPGKDILKVEVKESTEHKLVIRVSGEGCCCDRTVIMRPIDTVIVTPRIGNTTVIVSRLRSLKSPLGELDNIGIRLHKDQLICLSEAEMADKIDAIIAKEAEDTAKGASWQPMYHTSGPGYIILVSRGWEDRMHDTIKTIYYTEPTALEAAIQVVKDWVAGNK